MVVHRFRQQDLVRRILRQPLSSLSMLKIFSQNLVLMLLMSLEQRNVVLHVEIEELQQFCKMYTMKGKEWQVRIGIRYEA